MEKPPTLVCVHAHPDDEALFTAGISSHYGALGYQVVLVTCTNGALGLDQVGRPGSDPRHDSETTVATRAGELQRARLYSRTTRLLLPCCQSTRPKLTVWSARRATVPVRLSR